jgi:hypothetical protein
MAFSAEKMQSWQHWGHFTMRQPWPCLPSCLSPACASVASNNALDMARVNDMGRIFLKLLSLAAVDCLSAQAIRCRSLVEQLV